MEWLLAAEHRGRRLRLSGMGGTAALEDLFHLFVCCKVSQSGLMGEMSLNLALGAAVCACVCVNGNKF